MPKKDFNKEALELHMLNGGKLEIKSKVPLNDRDDLSRAYSPGVAEISRVIGEDKDLAKILTLKKNTIAIVSDGSSILGLGNLGASAAIPVMEGKAIILKEFANVDAFPICIESQDTKEIINIIKNIAPVFGGINLEDISAPKCFEIEEILRKELDIPVMHDDQWGAATASLTALINSMKLLEKEGKIIKKEDFKIVFSGVGSAGIATARLFLDFGFTNLYFIDSKGLITEERKDLTKEKIELLDKSKADLSEYNMDDNLEKVLKNKDMFVGLSKPDVLNKKMIESMNIKPIIFALANPTPEIMPEEAKDAGAFIIATGRSDYPNQINNSLIFPGFWKGILAAIENKTYNGVDNNIFIKIAKALADHVKDLNTENILPNMFDRKVVEIVAKNV